MTRFQVWTIAWAAALAVGFAAVFTLGRPLPSEAEVLDAAFHPSTPVSQFAAEASAATIIRLQYPDLASYTPTVTRRTDFGVERWVITYASDGALLSGAQVSVAIGTGQVEVAAFP
jgi:hypothetical protein